ncbi:uncharacterized protein LOC114969687 [Acropora millepora]|uniref:uncharacterized protein LOC114969687 n=1 Tax=Acropora millepora TaxID=45264 RepID=UPI001CF4D240|nr:uncharacterized protein LOC114969687 [Acropora millepora]
MYERLIKEIKKTLYKTLGKTHLTFELLGAVIIDIERHLNNRPLTYVESDEGGQRTLTPNVLIRGQNAHGLEDIEIDEEEVTKLHRHLKKIREHAWRRWQKEYVRSLMEAHRVNRKDKPQMPEVGEIVLVVGENRNRGEWKKAKVVQHVKGRDGVVLLHKGNKIRRPLQLVCPIEITSCSKKPAEVTETTSQEPNRSVSKRRAADDARTKIKSIADSEFEFD